MRWVILRSSSGDEEASIYATPNGAYSDYNWVTAAFRKCTTYIQPTSNSGGSVTKVTDRIKYDINVRYMFVDGEDANYTGLAKRYREYLLEKDELIKVEDTFKVRLDFWEWTWRTGCSGKRMHR